MHKEQVVGMRTNIEIDDELLSQAMKVTGLSTKRATVEEGLRLLVRVREQAKALAELHGLGWEDDLEDRRWGREPRRSGFSSIAPSGSRISVAIAPSQP